MRDCFLAEEVRRINSDETLKDSPLNIENIGRGIDKISTEVKADL